MISIKDFVKMIYDEGYTAKIVFEWNWIGDGLDDEYSFEGTPAAFLKKYNDEYDCIDNYCIDDLSVLKMENYGYPIKIYMLLECA